MQSLSVRRLDQTIRCFAAMQPLFRQVDRALRHIVAVAEPGPFAFLRPEPVSSSFLQCPVRYEGPSFEQAVPV